MYIIIAITIIIIISRIIDMIRETIKAKRKARRLSRSLKAYYKTNAVYHTCIINDPIQGNTRVIKLRNKHDNNTRFIGELSTI